MTILIMTAMTVISQASPLLLLALVLMRSASCGQLQC